MSSANEGRQATMDATQVYREEIFTDRKVGTIRRMTPGHRGRRGGCRTARPVRRTGASHDADGGRTDQFRTGRRHIGPAVEKFGAAAEQAVQQTMRELQELRREQASSLVIPDAAGAGCRIPAICWGGRPRR